MFVERILAGGLAASLLACSAPEPMPDPGALHPASVRAAAAPQPERTSALQPLPAFPEAPAAPSRMPMQGHGMGGMTGGEGE